MEVKLGAHVCNIISMTTTLFEQQEVASGILFKIASSLLKLVNGTTHGDKTWYACM